MEIIKIVLAIVSGLVAFALGLLAYRHQLLDKRKFEVAEKVIVDFAEIWGAIGLLRLGSNEENRTDFIAKKTKNFTPSILGPTTLDEAIKQANQEYEFGIPKAKREKFNEAFKRYESTLRLAELYLSEEVVAAFRHLEGWYLQITVASYRLYRGGLSAEETDKLIDERFVGISGEPDWLHEAGTSVSRDLQALCAPYTNQGPYRFLWSFICTLKPDCSRVWAWAKHPDRWWHRVS